MPEKFSRRSLFIFKNIMTIHRHPSGQLSKQEVERGLRAVIKDGVMSHLMGVLTGGAFLVGLALKLGASNAQIGLLAAILPLSQVIQIPAILLVNHVKSRKKVVVTTALIGRAAWVLAALSPFLFSASLGLIVLIGTVFLQSFASSVGGCAWNSWLRDLVPESRMGRFFSLRSRIAIFLGLFASLMAGRLVDMWPHRFPGFELGGYTVLFSAGCLAGMAGVYFISRIPDIPMIIHDSGLLALFKKPFHDKNYLRLLKFLAVWYFAVNLAAPFFTVYMMKRLGMSMTGIAVMSIVSQVSNMVFLGLWGKWADHFSNKSVLAVSGPLYMCTIFAWTFTSVTNQDLFTWPLLAAVHVFMGISMAGVSLAVGNIGLKLAPRGQATVYLVVLSLVNAVAAGTAPIIGGKLADFFSHRSLSFALQWTGAGGNLILRPINLRHWDFLFGLAFLIGFYALRRLALVEETGHTDDKVVFKELLAIVKRPFRMMSSRAGMRRPAVSLSAALVRRDQSLSGEPAQGGAVPVDAYSRRPME